MSITMAKDLETNIKMDFSDLLEELSTIEGLERIRFTSPHPLHMDDKF